MSGFWAEEFGCQGFVLISSQRLFGTFLTGFPELFVSFKVSNRNSHRPISVRSPKTSYFVDGCTAAPIVRVYRLWAQGFRA